MIYLKADTAVEVLVGPAVAVGDGFTPVTNLVGSSADEYELIKYNGATALTAGAPTNALAAITGADGYYSLELATGDVNTEGPLWLVINDDSLVLPIRHEFMVVTANVYDSLYGTGDLLDVNDIGDNSAAQVAGIILGTCGSGSLTISTCSSDLSGLTADQLIGRLITFYGAGPASGEQANITDFVVASGVLSFDNLTLAPENTNPFKIT